jgi:predicted RND superfamily exporter protein
MLSGIYIKYAIAGGMELNGAVESMDLLAFVVDNMSTHELLKLKMSDENRTKVVEAQEAVAGAEELFKSENYARMLISVDLPSESEESTAFAEYLSAAVKEVFGEHAYAAGEMMSTYDLQKAFAQDNNFITVFTIVSIFLIVMIIFRSISLPVVLVTIIQGAVWIAMSTSLLTGPMFFMSYIVTTCILMGATIDYGILMSTNYVQNRATFDKKEALYRSVAAAMPTVFTSGLILMICGFVIGWIASQNAIATVGVLLGKGTLVSILMITIVLPSVLYLCDGFILKLSMKRKKAEEQR